MSTRNPVLRTVSTVAGALAACGLFSIGVAHAEEPGRLFDNGAFHFTFGSEVAVSTNRVEAPEGPVELVTVELVAPDGASDPATSFLTFVVFHADTRGPDGTLEGRADAALSIIVDAVVASMSGAHPALVDTGALYVGGERLDGSHFELRHGGATAVVRAVAMEAEGKVVVIVDQRASADEPVWEPLNTVLDSFSVGPAPEGSPSNGAPAPAGEDGEGSGVGDEEAAPR